MERTHSQAKRLVAFDALRFVAALMVVGLHHGIWDALTLSSPLRAGPGVVDVLKYGKFGVDVFFIISGFFVFMTAEGRSWGDFLVARLTRLYPVFLLCCTISFLVITAWGQLPASETPHWRNYLGNITLVSFLTGFLPGFNGAGYVDGVYWTLAYEYVWYGAVALLLVRGSIEHAQGFLWGMTGLSALLWGVLLLGWDERIGQIGQYLPYFLLGAQLYLLARVRWTISGAWCFAANLLLVGASVVIRATGALVHGTPHLLTFSPLWALLLVGASLVVMVLIAAERLRWTGGWMSVLGACTYPLYLLHDKAGVVLAQHLPWMRGLPGLAAMVGIMVLSAGLISRYVEPVLIRNARELVRRTQRLLQVPRGVRAAGSATPALRDQQQSEEDAGGGAQPAAAASAG
jgi:peptidoglycan/LPS O-acetylase OafA/YrhL